jgi:hypothetical protein
VARIVWTAQGERFYETGIDRGVLYIPNDPGVAWPGLISVAESPSGGDAQPFYFEGLKYLNIATKEEYEATITSLYAPAEFLECDGVVRLQNGLLVTQQPRRSFGLSYRTKIGNDVAGSDHAYKIHLVYNALAAPSSRPNETLNASGEPSTFSWAITTKPPTITGYRPTAHLVIDTRYTDPEILSDLEDLLYGTDEDFSVLPTPDELIDLLT